MLLQQIFIFTVSFECKTDFSRGKGLKFLFIFLLPSIKYINLYTFGAT